MNTRGQVTKYTPPTEPRRASAHAHLYLVPLKPSEGVGVEATGLAQLFERLTASMSTSETLTRALLERLEVSTPIDYQHVQAKLVSRTKVRYRNVGRLPPREVSLEVPLEDIDE